jgi:hypothetical protein
LFQKVNDNVCAGFALAFVVRMNRSGIRASVPHDAQLYPRYFPSFWINAIAAAGARTLAPEIM